MPEVREELISVTSIAQTVDLNEQKNEAIYRDVVLQYINGSLKVDLGK
jgi:hypothetical protein